MRSVSRVFYLRARHPRPAPPGNPESGPSDMDKIFIIGLGNPGYEYKSTRHNAGFMVVDRFAARLGRAAAHRKSRSRDERDFRFEGGGVTVIKPLLYMNRSGDALLSMRDELLSPRNRLLVVVDDASLPFGTLRFRPKGSAGGQKGMKSIQKMLGVEEIHRLRFGIGANQDMPLEDYVLMAFASAERRVLPDALERAVDAVEVWLRDGIEQAMNEFNRKQKEPDS